MDSRSVQIPPPKNWQDFEFLCLTLFQDIWGHPTAQKNGRAGQPQHGVDVHGYARGDVGDSRGVQCKGKDGALNSALTQEELLAELAKAERFQPPLKHWILATTSPSDGELQRMARELSERRQQEGKFSVQVLGWGDIEQLLGDRPRILAACYPDYAAFVTRESERSVGSEAWTPIAPAIGRDIGPALLGRSLGPGDALACPRLPETVLAVQHLRAAYSARLIGDPGAGKSVCAFQIAHEFSATGWNTYSVDGSDGLPDTFPPAGPSGTLLLVDDAHLVPQSQLRALEAQANSKLLVLSTHNLVDGRSGLRGSIRLDPLAGIRVIADGLLKNRAATLAAVRRVDDSVGDQPLDLPLESRIEVARNSAQVPWQFCFVLGGGWRRVGAMLNTVKAIGAELTLCAIAALQIATRDAKGSRDSISKILAPFEADTAVLEQHIQSLAAERLVLSVHDIRCPHQHFASVLLETVLAERSSTFRSHVLSLLSKILASNEYALSGQRNILSVLTNSRHRRSGSELTLEQSIPMIERCWSATDPGEMSAACVVLWELSNHVEDWPKHVFGGWEATFARWVESGDSQIGHAMGRLTGTLCYKDEAALLELRRNIDPIALARRVSAVDQDSAWGIAELFAHLYLGRPDSWSAAVLEAIDGPRLVSLARNWSSTNHVLDLARLIEALAWPLEQSALDMLEAAIPYLQRCLHEDPAEHASMFWDLGWKVLGLFDPLGRKGSSMGPASQRQRHLGRALFQGLNIDVIASKFSVGSERQFDQIARFILTLKTNSPRGFKKLVQQMDWSCIADSIGDGWTRPPHHVEILLAVAGSSQQTRPIIASCLKANLHRVRELPMRLFLIAPELGLEHLKRGGKVPMHAFDNVDWTFGPFVVSYLAEEAPGLLSDVVTDSLATMANSLSQPHESWYEEAAPLLEQLDKHIPASLHEMLDRIAADAAQIGWTAASKADRDCRKAVGILLRAASSRQDKLGEVARELLKSGSGRRRKFATRSPATSSDP